MGGGYTITIPQDVPTSSITQDGETLYFQGWIKNGVVSTIYTPNEEVEVGVTDVFTPYYAKDPEYSDFTFTVDSVTGEYILAGANKSITSATIPALYQGQKVSVMKDRAFALYKSLQTVEIPQTITKIGDYAFAYCSKLTSINIPDSVTSIGDHVFRSCNSLTSVTIGSGVTSLSNSAFYYTPSLTSINVDSKNLNYCSIDGVLYDKNVTTLIQYPGDKADTSYTIPDSLTKVTGTSLLFCKNLISFVVDDNLNFCSIDGVLFNKNATTLVRYPQGKTDTSYTIPNSVINTQYGAFYACDNLSEITIPNSVITIGEITFGYCSNLTKVTMGENVRTIVAYAFYDCSSLTSIEIPNSVTAIGIYAFEYCTSLTSIEIPDNIASIGVWAFATNGKEAYSSIEITYSGTVAEMRTIHKTNIHEAAERGVCYTIICSDGKEYIYVYSSAPIAI